MARLSHLAGGLWRRRPDNCEINLAAPRASGYFSIQFFASLEKWIGARNPVRIGSSCAAVTGYNFPIGPIPELSGVKAGGRGLRQGPDKKPGARIFHRSTSFVPACAVREKTSSQKEE